MIREGSNIFFDNDDEFAAWCLEPNAVISGADGIGCYDYPFTSMYNDAIAAGDCLYIKDPCSKIVKRGCVCKGFITKKVPVMLADACPDCTE